MFQKKVSPPPTPPGHMTREEGPPAATTQMCSEHVANNSTKVQCDVMSATVWLVQHSEHDDTCQQAGSEDLGFTLLQISTSQWHRHATE